MDLVLGILALAWLAVFVASIFVAINAFNRWGGARGAWALLCPLGVLFFVMLGDTLVIGTYDSDQPTPPRAWAESIVAALLGVVLAVVGWIKTHPREFPAGCCQKCGYDLKELAKCPECGTERPAVDPDLRR